MITRLVQLATLSCALLLAGCDTTTGEPATLPDITTPPVETPTPSAAPTVEPPAEPADAHEYTAAGVEAFTLYAIDVINHAYQTNDVTHLKQISTDNCEFCKSTIDRLVTIGNAGGRVEGGQLRPEDGLVSVSGPAEGVQTSAGVEMSITASTTIDGDGQVRDSQAEEEFYAIFNFTREGEVWRLDEVFRTDGPNT